MTQARATIFLAGQHGLYHCTNRCVRRAWLCGIDPDTKQNYEHRKTRVEARIQQLGAIFAVGIYGYAVMSNHLHVVLSVEASAAEKWSKEEVVERWLQLYPARTPEQMNEKRVGLLGNPDAIVRCRNRLMDLSWFMRGLDEFVARQANAEDGKTGRFWQGRFKCQSLTDERALAAAMAYVDLNPIRAGIADTLEDSEHTSVALRLDALRKHPEQAEKPLQPIVGIGVFQRLSMSNRQYIDLVDFTGRQVRPGKRGSISESEPSPLRRLGLGARHWTGQVQGIGSGYWRIVGSVETLIERAQAARQSWMKGVGFARRLASVR